MPPDNKQLDAAGDAGGQTAGRGDDAGVDERLVPADLDADGELGRVHVDGKPERLHDGAAGDAAELHRVGDEALVGAAGFDLEARFAAEPLDLGARQLDGGGADGGDVALHDLGRRQRRRAEQPRQRRHHRRHAAFAGERQQPAVNFLDARAGDARDGALRVLQQHALEKGTIFALQEDFAEADHDDVGQESSFTVAMTASAARATSSSVVRRDSDSRMVPTSSRTPMARNVADGFLSRAWQADPAET